ncbi:MAG: hypothetical protein JNN17_02605 [Verrucomicrobiaceae bacterium]|nr:hypothetical protein [Verrucomicrobiaceae bacterium]
MARLGIDDNAPSLTEVEKSATVRRVLSARQPTADTALDTTMSVLMSRHWRAM